jgi:uncharacterized protein
MGLWRCPVCGRVLGPDDTPITQILRQQPHFPFCSSRCRLVDLKAWLDGDYRVEAEPESIDGPQDSPGLTAND